MTASRNTFLVLATMCGLMLTTGSLARADVIYVDVDAAGADNGTTWGDAFNDLQDGLAAADADDEVWVAAGTYTPAPPDGDRQATFQFLSGVGLYGGFAGGETELDQRDWDVNVTILSGDLNGDDGPDFENNDDNSETVTTIEGSGVFDGFIITAGNDTTSSGGALRVSNGSPSIRHCRFMANAASTGGAAYVYASSPTFTDCAFIGNRAGAAGAVYSRASHVLGADPTAPIFVDCRFVANSADFDGGAILIACGTDWSGECPAFFNCAFIGNSAGGSGGGIWHDWSYYSGSTLVNCLFSGNSAGEYGGAMYVVSSFPEIFNCTFSGNTADFVGGLYATESWDPAGLDVYNSILWGNSDAGGTDEFAQFIDSSFININFSYCTIQGWTGTTGGIANNADDPLFIDADGPDDVIGTEDDNARLSLDSPAIDAGSNSLVAADQTDLDGDGNTAEAVPFDLEGNARFVDDPASEDTGEGQPPIVDRGAYESPVPGLYFLIEPASISVPEGETAFFTVALSADPQSSLTVSVFIQGGDSDITILDGSSLNFDSTDYSLPKPVTLSCAEDDDFANGFAVVTIQAQGLPTQEIVATEADNEPVPVPLYVNSAATGANSGVSWEDAMLELRDALAVAASQPGVQELWVASGNYRPAPDGGDREATFMLLSGVALYGGFAGGETTRDERDPVTHITILSGDLNGDDGADFANNEDNSYHVVTGSGADSTALLDGFTVTAGNANLTNARDDGGGLYINAGGPTIHHCLFLSNMTDNTEAGGGGAVYVGPDSTPFLSDCSFSGNLTDGDGAAVYAKEAAFTMLRCTMNSNTAHYGGGIYVKDMEASFNQCYFLENVSSFRGGGLHTDGAVASLINCFFAGNQSSSGSGGAIWATSSNLSLANCVISGNIAEDHGGGLYLTYSPSAFANCTLIGNTALDLDGGGIYFNNWADLSTISNSIFWDNVDPGGSDEGAQISGGIPVLNYSCVKGLTGALGGLGNISDDPTLVDPDGADDIVGTADDDLHLVPGSPCIDAADNAAVPMDTEDLDDDSDTDEQLPLDGSLDPRFVDDPTVPDSGSGTPPIVDIGAYEYQGDCNGNNQSDDLDILTGVSSDCNDDWVPDECELDDCNANGVPDDCDIADGTSLDCEPNAIPDECDLAGGTAPDCNSNGIPDFCDIESAVSSDCDHSGVPDECEIADGTLDDADGDGIPDVCASAVLYVKPDASGEDNGLSWSDAYRDLQDALAHATQAGGAVEEIWVAAGTYKPTGTEGDRLVSFELVADVELFGGFAGGETKREQRDPGLNETILSGDLNGNDGPDLSGNEENSYHVLIGHSAIAGTILDGFTVIGGNADQSPNDLAGGGLFVEGAAPTIKNCVFRQNYGYAGGALHLDYAGGVVEACTFEGNQGIFGAGIDLYESEVTITGCSFLANFGNYGGGLKLGGSQEIRVINCRFEGNEALYAGGAVHIFGADDVDFVGCLFMANFTEGNGAGIYTDNGTIMVIGSTFLANSCQGIFASGGGIYSLVSDTTAVNCLFVSNWVDGTYSGSGGAVSSSGVATELLLTNCTIVDNSAMGGSYGDGGGVSTGSSNDAPVIINCILWGNEAQTGSVEIAQIDAESLVVSYSVIEGLDQYEGNGNIGLDPLFANSDGPDGTPGTEDDDWRLSSSSPAIDAASNAGVPPDTADLDLDGDTAEPTPLDLGGSARFVDDPGTPDSGSGEPPIVDMGAYEFQIEGIPCEGDANGDGTVDPLDAGFVLARFGCPVGTGDPNCDAGDMNGDGLVDPLDSGFVLARFGECL